MSAGAMFPQRATAPTILNSLANVKWCTDGCFYLLTVEFASRFFNTLGSGEKKNKKRGENRKPEHTSNTFNNFVVFPCYKEMESQEFWEVHRGNPKNIVYKTLKYFILFQVESLTGQRWGGGPETHTKKPRLSLSLCLWLLPLCCSWPGFIKALLS